MNITIICLQFYLIILKEMINKTIVLIRCCVIGFSFIKMKTDFDKMSIINACLEIAKK